MMTAPSKAPAPRLALLGGVSLLGIVASWLAPYPAFASCPISSATTGPVNISSDCSITSSGVITSNADGIVSSGTYGTLSNSGSISAFEVGINNSANLGTLVNTSSGTISSTNYAVFNEGDIASLANAGSILGGIRGGIINEGTITNFTNSSRIGDTSDYGLVNGDGLIGTLDNTAGASITGLYVGLINEASLSSLGNSGTISGHIGFDNFGSAGTLTNIGAITGTAGAGFVNGEGISDLANSGNITGTTTGFANTGAISQFSNSGLLQGGSAGVGVGGRGSFGTLTNGAGGTIAGGAQGILLNSSVTEGNNTYAGSIALLSNDGLITGTSAGIDDLGGDITLLLNSGTITGTTYGVLNSGVITTATNAISGIISSSASTAFLNTGAIGSMTNAGSITGRDDGMANDGTISSFTNTGRVGAAVHGYGLYNATAGSIGTIENAIGASITGLYDGLYNKGTLTSLGNSGTIAGGETGMENDGSIATLSNIGTIMGTDYAAAFNEGTISNATNSGHISGTTSGFTNVGTIGQFSNIGTISGSTAAGFGDYHGYYSSFAGYIGSFGNSGVVEGGSFGIGGSGIFGTLTNEGGGTIQGGTLGVLVERSTVNSTIYSGSIALLTNDGLITGTVAGIDDLSGTITLLDNAGTVTAGQSGTGTLNADGIENSATLDTLISSGQIIAAVSLTGTGTLVAAGVENSGQLSTFMNSGSIAANSTINGGVGSITAYGLENTGTIGSFLNSGSMTASGYEYNSRTDAVFTSGLIDDFDNQAGGYIGTSGGTAIENTGSILTFSNAGTITDTNEGYVIENSGSIGSVLNTGTVSGLLEDDGTISFIDNEINATLSYVQLDTNGQFPSMQNAGTVSGIFNAGTLDVLSNLASGDFGGNYYFGLINAGALHTLTNAGTIDADSEGVANYPDGTIDLLLNTGDIGGGALAIDNDGSITLLQNDSLISSPTIAVDNISASSIGTLLNEGSIVSTDSFAVSNAGTIGTLDNLASISGYTAIGNTGEILALTNSGLISGTVAGIDNSGTIGMLENTHTISGGANGLNNSGIITSIVNSGLITGTTFGIDNTGTIGGILNTGTISGRTGLNLSAGNITLVNSGTVIGTGGTAILTGGNDDLIFATGSDLQGVINGRTATSAIKLQGAGGLVTNIVNFAGGSALEVVPGADWSAEGNWALSQVTNDGTFQPGVHNGTIGAPLTITGNYAQEATGVLAVEVTPESSSALNISGLADLDGEIDYAFAPGIYTAHTYAVLTSGTLSGKFTEQAYTAGQSTKSVTISTVYLTDPGVDLVISAAAITPSTPSSPTSPSIVLPVPDAALFSAQRQALAEDAQTDTGLLLDQAASGAPARACAIAAPSLSGAGSGGRMAQLAAELANGFCGAGGWIAATGDLFNASAGQGAAGYNANTGGFLAGIDKPVGASGPRLGFAVGYDDTSLTERGSGSASTGVVRLALYGAQQISLLTLTGVLDYGSANGNVTRAAGIADFKSDDSANVFGGGLQAATVIDLGRITLNPAAGLRFASVSGGHFAEETSPELAAYAVHGTGPGYASTQPYATLQLGQNLLTPGGLAVGTHLRIGYQYEAGDTGVRTDPVTADGTTLPSDRNHLAPSAAVLGAAVSVGKDNWSLYANYAGHVASNWNDETGEFGLKVVF